MARANLEFNNFSAGLVTQVSELTSPDTAIREMSNFDLQPDGSAYLRAPLRAEVNSVTFADVTGAQDTDVTSEFVWHSPGGDTSVDILFIQHGSAFKILRRPVGIGQTCTDITVSSATSLQGSGVYPGSLTFSPVEYSGTRGRVEFAASGQWCVATGLKAGDLYESVIVFEYDKPSQTVTAFFDFLWVRDFWGVQDTRLNGWRVAAPDMTDEVLYNLCNQGWDTVVNGSGVNRFILKDFYNNSGLNVADAICASQSPAGAGAMTINGTETVSGVWYSDGGPCQIITAGTSVPNITLTGLDEDGNTVTETITGAGSSVYTYVSISSVSAGAAGTSVTVGTDKLYPGDRDTWSLGASVSGSAKIFNPKWISQAPDISGDAPKGHYVIPAHYRSYEVEGIGLTRGAFGAACRKLLSVTPALPDDRSGRPHCAASFAGRLFYGSTKVAQEYDQYHTASPDISGYIFFSRIIKNREDVTKCYQSNDPTSADISDVLADDGGFIYIPDLGNLISLKAVGNALLVIADNGTWYISGDQDVGFKATSYQQAKLSSSGTDSPASVLSTGSAVLFFGFDGIEAVTTGQAGLPAQQNITSGKNRKYFLEQVDSYSTVKAVYDYVSSKARFLISGTKEIVVNLSLEGAVEVHDYVLGSYSIQGYLQFQDDARYKFSGTDIVAPSYLVILKTGDSLVSGQLRYDDDNGETFSWEDVGGEYGSTSHVTCSHIVGGESTRNKRATYVITHFKQTEDQVIVDISGDAELVHPSGCTVTAYWGWANTETSPFKGGEFQAYRLRRQLAVAEAAGTYDYDYGQSVISTKNKLRGYGKAVSLKFKAEANKDCRILGYALDLDVPGSA